MEVRERMHFPPVTCEPSGSLADAARRMREDGIGTLMVVDHHGAMLGIVTDRDLVVQGLAEGLGPEVSVESVMSRDPMVVHGYDDVFIAASKMATHGYRRLPVVDHDGHLEGMISLDDLTVIFVEQLDKMSRTIAGQKG
jgi:CBS domain-containing protein